MNKVSAFQELPQERITGTTPRWRVRGAAVTALWGIVACWIAFERIHPPHRVESLLWMASVGLMLTAAASSTMIMWYLARVHIEPSNDQSYMLRTVYRAGYLDGADASRTRLHLLPHTYDARANDPRTRVNGSSR